jgi:hypothetical protein
VYHRVAVLHTVTCVCACWIRQAQHYPPQEQHFHMTMVLSALPTLGIPIFLAAASPLLKSLHAITTCHAPCFASAAAALRPSPDDAPVMMAVGFWVALSVLARAAGRAASSVAAACSKS